ncbi:DUF5684 domain-containing protein [Microbacterium sp.]|uniref:DUF5684 domain-containing protein n=1 Tax=Microbacterium sp. TaxID=51671 RepID=UPI0028A0AF26|nr:DUF5684 domain-containing protein [Microbacterium sp.]
MDESVVALLSLLSLVVGVALYVWTALALGAMFRKMGEEAWKGWVPLLNVATVLRWGGFSPWLVLLALIPPLSIVVFVLVVISAHRINSGFGYGAGMTVLAALVFVVWASILGFGPARWLGARPAGWKPPEPVSEAEAEPAASAPRTPAPGSPFASLFPGADAAAPAPAAAFASGPVPAPAAPAPASAVPSASAASSAPEPADPLSAFAPPPVTAAPAWTPPDTTTTPPPRTAADTPVAASAVSAAVPSAVAAPEPVSAAPAASEPVSVVPPATATASVPPAASEQAPAAPPAAAQPPISAVPPAPAAAPRSAPVPAAGADSDPRAAASAVPGEADRPADDDAKWPSEVDDVSAIAPSHYLPASAAGGRHVVPPVTADDAPIDVVPGRRSTAVPPPESATVTRVPAAQPSARAARAEQAERAADPVDAAADTVIERPAPTASVPPVTTEAPRAVRSAVDPDAEPPSRRARPWPAFAVAPGEPEDFPELSGEVSAVIGSPAAGSPRSALHAVSAQQRRLEPFADDDDLDQTVITRRAKKPTWQLVPASGAPVPLTSDVVILGRRPAGDAAFPGAQLVAVPGDARTVSKTHARLERKDETWVVTDLGSTNGVLVRTLMGDEIEVESGGQIDAGERFFLGDEEFHLKQIER